MSQLSKLILGALQVNPSLIDLNSGLNAADFEGRERELFELVSEAWQKDKRVDEMLIAEKLGGDGAVSFISSFLDGAIKIEPAAFCARVNQLKKDRLSKQFVQEVNSQLKTDLDIDSLDLMWQQLKSLGRPSTDIIDILKPGLSLQEMDLTVNWTVQGLIPERSITILHGSGGIGKTWIGLQIATAVNQARPVFGLNTGPRPVIYIDYENPLPVLVERIKKTEASGVLFWHLAFDPPPPRLDSDDHYWELYKKLPVNSLVIIDSLRASHSLEENSSRDMALIMNRFKELREQGRELLILHHTPKFDSNISKGSTAIVDLADQVISLARVKNFEGEEIDTTIQDDAALYRLGTGGKTRYDRFGVFLRFTGHGFELAEDPDQSDIQAIAEFIRIADRAVTQTEIKNWAKAELEIKSKRKVEGLLRKGETSGLWHSHLEPGNKNRRVYLCL